MSDKAYRAWLLVNAKVGEVGGSVFDAGESVRKSRPSAIEVIGVYDVVVDVEVDTLDDLYTECKNIGNLDSVQSATTYLAVRRYDNLVLDESRPRNAGGRRARRPTAVPSTRVCVLIEAQMNVIDTVWLQLQERRRFPEVEKADVVLGTFDIILVARIEPNGLSEFLHKLTSLPGISRTMTMTEVKPPTAVRTLSKG